MLQSQSRKYYRRFYVLVVFAVILMMAVLTGSLMLGDSVRGTLVQRVGERLGQTETIIASGTGLMSDELLSEPELSHAHGVLLMDGFVPNGQRLLPVYVWGTDADSLQAGECLVNEPLSSRMDLDPSAFNSGQEPPSLVLHLPSHHLVPSGSLFVTKSYATQMHLRVKGVKCVSEGGNMLLKNEQALPLNVFVNRKHLAECMDVEGKINLILSDEVITGQQLAACWTPAMSGIHLSDTSLTYDGVFIPQSVMQQLPTSATTCYFSYLVNELATDSDTIPYSFVTAVSQWEGEPLTGRDMILSDYAALRLHVREGDSVNMSYFVARQLKNLDTRQQSFRVKHIVPLSSFRTDSLLVADFPGLTHVEKCTDWDSDLPINLDRIEKEDEDFWYAYRQTPKAIVAYDAVCADWSNAFGSATAVRFASRPDVPATQRIEEECSAVSPSSNPPFSQRAGILAPADAGIRIDHPRAQGLHLASNGVDFAGLFLSLGFFIIIAAILLLKNPLSEMFALRAGEISLYRQLGFQPAYIIRRLFREAFGVMLLAAPVGVVVGLLYTSLTLWLLAGLWSGATHTEGFGLHIRPLSLLVGFLAGLIICAFVLWRVLRAQMRQCDEPQNSPGTPDSSIFAALIAGKPRYAAILHFSFFILILLIAINFVWLHSMVLFIVCGLLWILIWGLFFRQLVWCQSNRSERTGLSRGRLTWLSLRASFKQHLLAYWTLALGVFTVFAVGLNRPDFSRAKQTTGGYQVYIDSRVPIQYDLNHPAVRRKLSLQALPDSTRFLSFLRHTADEASCLNLNQVATPTVLGIDLQEMEPFGLDTAQHATLNSKPSTLNYSLYIDQEALMWSLKKSVGDTLFYQDHRGQSVPVLIAGTYPTGLFHGNAIMEAGQFRQLWPKESGVEVLLMKSSEPRMAAEILATAMSQYGLSIQPVDERIRMFFEVTETYLIIFLTLGGLGLLLGIFSLFIILRKNLTAQSGTLRQYRAMGFFQPTIQSLLLRENLIVPFFAVAVGATGAVISISANVSGAGAGTFILALVILAAIGILLYYGVRMVIRQYTIHNSSTHILPMKRTTIFILCSSFFILPASAQQVTFRGVNHCGIYPDEQNLLKQWPAEGPQKLWVANDAGKGNSSALVSDGFIYTAGLTPDEQGEQLTCFKLDGTKVWQVTYGHAWKKSFQETRSTPVIDDDRLYMVSNTGELVCLKRADGNILWTVDYWKKYDITPNDQGICEHPLIDGDKVIVTTCGREVCMAAFNKLTGDVLWETKGFGDKAAYCASRIIQWNGHRQVVGGTEEHIFGVDPDTGTMIWHDSQWTPAPADKKWLNAMINCPVFYQGKLLVSLGDGHGCTMYQMADDLSSVKLLWKNKELDFYMGGMVEVDGIVYGSTGDKHKWAALDIATGDVRYHSPWAGGKGRGALIMADNMFYMFDERRGTVGLANINPDRLDVVSEFRITDGAGACFAHPTIFDGVLYVRRGTALMAYNIKQ